MNFITAFTTAISLVPTVITLITDVETAIGPGRGSDKLEAVRVKLEQGYAVVSKSSVDFAKIWTVLKPIVGILVPLLTKKK